jgi:hypothetical protein
MENNFFKGRDLIIATMHKKEEVIAPLFYERLGVNVIIPEGLDTDLFGTFTGEIERDADPVTTAEKKCLAAAEKFNCSLVLASEGSFGPHPAFYFAPCDDEVMIFMDLINGFEVSARKISGDTNFNGKSVKSWEEAEEFGASALFPSHSLIVRASEKINEGMVKGIREPGKYRQVVEGFLHQFGHAFIETDMRAMHNPTRMKVIGEVAMKLVETLNRFCPACQIPGFDVVEITNGLPCEFCTAPTRSTLAYIYGCKKCGHREESKYPHGKTLESPMYCDRCNP